MKHFLLKTIITVFFFSFTLSLVAQSGMTIEKQVLDRAGNPRFVKFDTNLKSASVIDSKVLLSSTYNMSNSDEFKQVRVDTDKLKGTHERFQQFYKGIKVENGVCIVHKSNNIIESISGEYKTLNDISTNPTITLEDAISIANDYVDADEYVDNNTYDFGFAPEIVIVANDFGKHPTDVHPMVLAYRIDVYASKPLRREFVYVDAQNGAIVHTKPLIYRVNEVGTAATRYSGSKSINADRYNSKYRLRDYSRGNGIITYNCNESTSYNSGVDFTDGDNNWTSAEYNNSDKDNGALDAHWAAMMTYDYFQSVHNRNSFDGNGKLIKTYVHYDKNYENAYWNGSVFTFGDGASYFDILTSLDVFGHEFGHAVCSYTSDLTYSAESGALNEAFSDIWGCAIEKKYAPNKDNWIMGEDLGNALRDISNPKAKGLPDTYKGENWHTGSSDNYGVHTNNGPFCYWFYLISEGGSGTNDNNDAYSVTPIGITKAEQITYRVESVYMTSSSDYADARTYCIQAAKDLYGADSQAEKSVTDAMHAIGVGDAYGGGATPGVLTYCVSKGTKSNEEWIAKVELGSFSKSSSGKSYSDYTSSAINVNTGSTYDLTLTPGFNGKAYKEYWKVWIDYDNDTIFSDNELVYDAGGLSTSVSSGSITIKSGVNGYRRMRVSMKYNGEQTACETFSNGEVEDYHLNISSGLTDTEAPSKPTGLVASNITSTSCSLKWNASSDNVGVKAYRIYRGSTYLATSTSTSYAITGLSSQTTYQFAVCAVDAAGNSSSMSNSVLVTTNDNSAPSSYCVSQGGDSSHEWIDLVELGSMSNTTSSDGGYGDYTAKVANASIGENKIYLSAGFKSSSYTQYWHVWIDCNHNGIFDDNEEFVDGSSSSSSRLSGTFTIPATALLGETRMRVIMKYKSAATSACESFSYGEVEDYTVNITSSSYAFMASEDKPAESLGSEISNNLTIYPNPTSDILIVELENTDDGRVSIYDMKGALLLHRELKGGREHLDVSALQPGVYSIVINDGQKNVNSRFIKK